VSAIAKQFSGGGHQNAAGGKADKLQFVVTYDNGSGYREWASVAQPTPQKAIEVSDDLKFGDPWLELVAD
jgi:oligoribonuclease NrnB/cAMP/cGMP phosphodiesterase (DHH superfamily)